MNIYLEIFGYIGTAFVITSMMMSSVLKLRLVNTVGSVISMIYAILCNTWPVVILNFCLAAINIYKLIASSRVKVVFRHVTVKPEDETVNYFILNHRADIEKIFPEYDFVMENANVAYLIYAGDEMAGVLIGKTEGDSMTVELDYTTPKYRDRSVAAYMYDRIGCMGVKRVYQALSTEQHNKYLDKMGFTLADGVMVKELKSPDA
ncbi:MAG: YgjV family protein [Ruminococcaceae bacterium]|nr:YgjV family protein [Oscillospiraceae bacterium]